MAAARPSPGNGRFHAASDPRQLAETIRRVWSYPRYGTAGRHIIAEIQTDKATLERARDALAALLARAEAADEIENDLRREWWGNHGHPYSALYGDDGEMQCAACPADFKRQPMSDLRQAVFNARIARAALMAVEEREGA